MTNCKTNLKEICKYNVSINVLTIFKFLINFRIVRITQKVDRGIDLNAFTAAGSGHGHVQTGRRLPVKWQHQGTDTVTSFRK